MVLAFVELELESGLAQVHEDFEVFGVVEVVDDAVGDALAHILHRHQLLFRGVGDRIHRFEVAGELLGGHLAHKADAQGEHHPFERYLLRCLDARQDVLYGLFAEGERLRFAVRIFDNLLQTEKLLIGEAVEVGDIVHQSVGVEHVDLAFAEGVDVHGLAGDEVLQPALDLRGAVVGVGTEDARLALGLLQRGAADRAVRDERHPLRVGKPVLQVHTHDFGDDFAALFHKETVALADVHLPHEVAVVEGGAFHDGARQRHRAEIGHGCDDACPAHLEIDAEQFRGDAVGLELVGDGPSRALGCGAHLPLLVEIVDFDDNAVYGVGQRLPFLVPSVQEVIDSVQVGDFLHHIGFAESPFVEFHQSVKVVVGWELLA